ncbi:hypothetical protein HNQ02_002733 [Flavobacterium sp. 7E]|uniref:hypothetical protein n=1 Tax=unclassified Flavobacterium TaxID=196869 RepID=UPI0015711996|nr:MULTISPECIES: hypothetical protein [unclassified Flavobacterium]MBE0391879.1 hypothetical protein [Flavobacterium sp. PL002]NRS89799.1 hypothetical protein [Flavobacterium sp. 7E]
MKLKIIQISLFLTLFILQSCKNKSKEENNHIQVTSVNNHMEVDTIISQRQNKKSMVVKTVTNATKTYKDTLQYLQEGENEDNIYSIFLTKKLDTIRIVLENNEYLTNDSTNKMYVAEWENIFVTSGGDSEIKYQQAFMKRMIEIKTKKFK